jgi:NhaP-type Na+/H+ or K+/H+ antiporter
MIGSFGYLSIMSIIIGMVVGLLSALVLKYFNMHYDPVKETMAMLLFAYLSYLVSD